MTICRTCLSKNDLKPIFPDKNLVSIRSEQLYLVCGIKIEPDDGLTQLICESCSHLVNGALKLRELSYKAEKVLKNSLATVKSETKCNFKQTPQTTNSCNQNVNKKIKTKVENTNIESTKNKIANNKKVSTQNSFDKQPHQSDLKNVYSVCIEDFESSNDSDFMNNFLINDIESLHSDDETKVCIEDFESSDSLDENCKDIIKQESKVFDKCTWDLKEKELLQRERRKMMYKQEEKKLLSLAVTPFDSGGPIRCTVCNKQLRNIQNFKGHARTHFEPGNSCEECGKKFVTRSHMRYHMQRVHGRRKRLACSKCSYRAVDPMQLQNHERAEHTGERPYICDVCGDTFRMRANIVQHMRRHFGVRNLQCERCPAMFRSRSELTGHQNRVHYLVYTYLCYLCTETYKRQASVKKHLVNAHGVPRNQQLPIKCIKTRRTSGNSES